MFSADDFQWLLTSFFFFFFQNNCNGSQYWVIFIILVLLSLFSLFFTKLFQMCFVFVFILNICSIILFIRVHNQSFYLWCGFYFVVHWYITLNSCIVMILSSSYIFGGEIHFF